MPCWLAGCWLAAGWLLPAVAPTDNHNDSTNTNIIIIITT